MRPLDYVFEIIIGMYGSYGVYWFWKNYYKTDTNIDVDLIELYVLRIMYKKRNHA